MNPFKRLLKSTFSRYILAGGLSSLLDIVLFNGLTYFLGTYYIAAVVISNGLSFFLRFFLQRHYAFKEVSKDNMAGQLYRYALLFFGSVILTAGLMYIFVDISHINKSIAQIVSILLLAIISFFIYRLIVFPHKKTSVRKILLFTQKVDKDDPVLGFFHRWIEEISKQFESVIVICLEKGKYDLPDNVKVLSLGKEERQSRLQYLIHFYWYIWYESDNYDGVFVHMNQQYVILGAKFWKLTGKKIYMWRNHRSGNFMTDIAMLFCDKIFCTSRFSYTAKSSKTIIMPVGIDTELFRPKTEIEKIPRSILFLGRIAPIKKPDLLIEALSLLKKQGMDFSASFFGDPLPKDEKFFASLKKKVDEFELKGKISFKSSVPNNQTVDLYNSHEISVNLTPSGSFDKTILEAMACQTLVLVSIKDLEGQIKNDFLFEEGNVQQLSQKLAKILDMSTENKRQMSAELREVVVEKHSLLELVSKLRQQIQ